MQPSEELAVRVRLDHIMRETDRERGLSDPRPAGDGNDRRVAWLLIVIRSLRIIRCHEQQPSRLVDQIAPTGEIDKIRRQLAGYWRHRCLCRCQPNSGRGQRWIIRNDRALQFPKLRTRFDPQLLDQGSARVAVHVQGLASPTGAVQRQHVHLPQPFAKGVLADECGQLGPHRVVAIKHQLQLDAGLRRRLPQFHETADSGPHQWAIHVRERITSPQILAHTKTRYRLLPPSGGGMILGKLAMAVKLVDIGHAVSHLEQIARGNRTNEVELSGLCEDTTQCRDAVWIWERAVLGGASGHNASIRRWTATT